jgi:hypothetical protein
MDSRMAGDAPNSAEHRDAARLAECEARLATCAAELRRRAGDADALLARSAAQLRECQRLAAIVAQHERAGSVLQAAARQLRKENARLSDRLARRDREAPALDARIKTHEADQLQEENARLSDRPARRDREALVLDARIKTHEAEYRRLTRLLAERAREIFELRLALGPRVSATPRENE